ncbi:Mannitol dehydrogenase rossman domain family [Synechococcus sp. PCC 7335]|uniref:mannitol dehydrogenase family protein n=1 Tax=Synechococcus sp. (strain ATCC 29403 / PCC 7335) TaxID=91464 RepID=UPI00017EB52F|nr:mannitol dehydrogenase family protein [Synechococcus sp. PCC 7335]EDX83086.1 Mannitol dehydrogenase rossman domain family [Synechococcus sp. PCC 7335]
MTDRFALSSPVHPSTPSGQPTQEPIPLNSAALARYPQQVRIPRYDRASITASVVHIGVGGFHRSHQALYIDNYIEKATENTEEKATENTGEEAERWGICGVGLLKYDEKMRNVLQSQDCLYTLVERSSKQDTARIIGSITEYLFAPEEPQAVIDKLADETCRIVTLTITEGGYYVIEGTGEFDSQHPNIQHDLQFPDQPASVYGFLTAALKKRWQQGLPPFTVLSCDNVQGNGNIASKMLSAFAKLQDPDLEQWIAENVTFPNSMVDRITPATTPADIQMVAEQFGIEDRWPVVAEPFIQWVIEDNFCAGRPRWESVGVQMTDDVHPYEMMKLRLLNASHSLLGYLGSLLGYTYTSEAMEDNLIRRAIAQLMDEVTPTLLPLPNVDIEDYKTTLIERFSNPKVRDQLSRLCLNGSDKLPKFVFGSLQDKLAQGGSIKHLSFVVALWFRYLNGKDEQDQPIAINDPLSDLLTNRAKAGGPDPTQLFAITTLFGSLSKHPSVIDTVTYHLQQLYALGVEKALVELLTE